MPVSEKDRMEPPTSWKSSLMAVKAMPAAPSVLNVLPVPPRWICQKMHVKCIELCMIQLHPGPTLVPELIIVAPICHPVVEKTTPGTPRSKETFIVRILLYPNHFIQYALHIYMLFHQIHVQVQ